jgi:hypothetical protein
MDTEQTKVEKKENLSPISVEYCLIRYPGRVLWKTYPQKLWKDRLFSKIGVISQTYPHSMWISL